MSALPTIEQAAPTRWRNWSGSAVAQPTQQQTPADEDALRALVRDASALRVVGAGHSFTPLVPTAGIQVSLDRLSGLITHDVATCQV